MNIGGDQQKSASISTLHSISLFPLMETNLYANLYFYIYRLLNGSEV